MIHYTLNSGNTRDSPRAEVQGYVIASMAHLVAAGDHDLARFGPMLAGCRLVVPGTQAGYLATLFRGEAPLLTLGAAADQAGEEEVWPGLESLYLKITEYPGLRGADFAAPHKPDRLPWLAVALIVPDSVPHWAGDFERCLGWTWLERRGGLRG